MGEWVIARDGASFSGGLFVVVGGSGWLWVIVPHFLGDCGWLFGCGWLWVIVGGCASFPG